MMKSTKPQILLQCVLKTIGETAIFMSHWCLLQSLVQAVMWHNTEPRTLGICYWATGLFVAVLCLPGMIYALKSLLWPSGLKSNYCNKVKPFVHWIVRILPASALTVSALPQLDEYAGSRTCTLSLGIIFINLYVILLAWNSAKNNTQLDDISAKKTPDCTVINEETSYHVGNNLVLAICVTMAVRWCCGTINVFYERWHASLSITLMVYVYSSVILVIEYLHENEESFTSMTFSGSRLMETDKKQVLNTEKSETLPFKINQTTCAENGSLSDERSAETTKHYDKLDRKANIDDADSRENHQLCSDENNEAMVVSVTGDNAVTRQVCVTASYCYALIYAFVIGPALGALASIFIWIFTSPDVLCLWGEVSVKSMGYLIMICFVVGCTAVAVIDLERLCYGEEVELCADTKEKLKVKRNVIYRMIICGILCCLVTVGTSLILFTKRSLFLFGSSVLCLIIPSSLRMTLYMSYDLVMTCRSLQTLGKISAINAIPGLILCLTGSTFVVFYFFGICFINPQITYFFHGRMDLILLPEICLSILPLLFGPALRSKVKTVDRLRSSSTGPLLEGDAMICNTSDVSFSESDTTKLKMTRTESRILKQYTKTTQTIFLILLLVIATVVKYVSMESISTCDVSVSTCDDTEIRKDYDLRVMSWNILLGHKMNGRNNLNGIAHYTDHYNPHVLALQEASGLPAYWGGKDVFGYLQTSTKSCFNKGKIINSMQGSLEVGLLSRLKIIESSAAILPHEEVNKIPSYTMAKISCKVPSKCDSREEVGSGDIFNTVQQRQQNSTLHIYTIHAVYKNWTCERYSKLSCEQMKFLQDDIRKLPIDDPVIVMGDFNINPSEPELGMWYQSDLGFKSALWPSTAQNAKLFTGRCESNSNPPNDECDCECRNSLSDPPKSTLLNRPAAVDHIFYRGMRLVGKAKILEEVGAVSDHYPILADFAFQ